MCFDLIDLKDPHASSSRNLLLDLSQMEGEDSPALSEPGAAADGVEEPITVK